MLNLKTGDQGNSGELLQSRLLTAGRVLLKIQVTEVNMGFNVTLQNSKLVSVGVYSVTR